MKNLHPAARAAIVIAGAIVALNLILGGVDRASGGRRPGRPSSTYTTAPDGLAAYETLLRDSGREVTQIRRSLVDVTLPQGATVFVMDGVMLPDETQVVAAFVARGGRLVASGRAAAEWLPQVIGTTAEWTPVSAGDATVLAPAPEVEGVRTVRSVEPGVWSATGNGLPVLGNVNGELLFVRSLGRGRVVALASTSPLHNEHLDEVDNAALGLARARSQVLFVESVHGHVDGRGFGALAADARWAFALLAIAGCVWLGVRGRRLGPAESPARELAPARRLYVEALGASLRRSDRRGEAVVGVQHAARRRLAQRAGLRRSEGPEALRRAAPRFGLDAAEVESKHTPPRSSADVVAAGRALAKLEDRT